MECADIRRHLSEYIDNECPEEIRLAVASHLAECDDCRREYEQLSALSQRIRKLPQQELPFDFSAVMAEKLREEERRDPRRKPVYKRGWARALELCACLVLVLGLAGLGSRVFKGAGADMAVPESVAYYDNSSSAESRSYDEYADGMAKPADEEAVVAEAEMPEAEDASTGGASAADMEAMQRKIVMNWSLDLEVDDFDAAWHEIERIAADYGGYVVSGNTYGNSDSPQRDGFISIRVAADRARQAVEEISALGELQSNDFSSQDVTSDYYDIAARLSALETQEQRLLEMYGQAASVPEMLEIEDQLTGVRTQIESLQGTLNYYDQLTALSLIEIRLHSLGDYSQGVEPKGWQGFISKLKSNFLTGVNNTLDGLAGFLVWLVRVLPFLILLAAVVIVLWLIIRRRRRSRTKK